MTTTFAPPTGPPATAPVYEVGSAPASPPSGRRRHPLALGAAVVALVALGVGSFVVLAGGGSSNDTTLASITPFSLAAAAESTIAARSIQFDVTASAGDMGAVTVSGAIDNETKLVSVTTDLSSLLALGDTPLPFAGGEMQLLFDGANGVAYLSADALGGLGGLLPSGASWVSIDLAALAEKSGANLGDLEGQLAIDPADTARLLLDSDAAVEVGDETIDGVDTKHYQVTVDLAAALAAAPQTDVAELDGLDLPGTVVYDVWVTADNQLRRASFDTVVAGQPIAMTLDMTTSTEPLDATVPSGNDVFDLTGLLGF